jgi:hypothetical protein
MSMLSTVQFSNFSKMIDMIMPNDELHNQQFMVRHKLCLWHPMYIEIIKKTISDSEIIEFMNVLKIINRFREELNKRSSDVHRDIENGSSDNQIYGITISHTHHNEEESWWWVDLTDKSSWWITPEESELLYKYGWTVSYDKS